jgi:hypothetical protein
MIDRSTIIERSVESFVRNQLFTIRGYPEDRVVFLDAYPTQQRMTQPLDRNYVAIGYTADDGGKQAELGSPLRTRKYTIDFYVFGISRVWGKNLAEVIRFSLESEGNINLLDPRDGTTIIDSVIVDFVSAQQAITRTPRPWEENAWITRLRIEDIYSSASGG